MIFSLVSLHLLFHYEYYFSPVNRPVAVTMQRPWPDETKLPIKVMLLRSTRSASSEMSKEEKDRERGTETERERESEGERERYRKRERER